MKKKRKNKTKKILVSSFWRDMCVTCGIKIERKEKERRRKKIFCLSEFVGEENRRKDEAIDLWNKREIDAILN